MKQYISIIFLLTILTNIGCNGQQPKEVKLMNVPTPELFDNTFKKCFNDLISKYHYSLITDDRSNKYCSYLKYQNRATNRIIQVSQEPYYTNYGFTISIINMTLNESKIIYNLPGEKEDSKCDFVKTAFKTLFTDGQSAVLINGQEWHKGVHIRSSKDKPQSVYTKIQIEGHRDEYYKDGKEIDSIEWSNKPE